MTSRRLLGQSRALLEHVVDKSDSWTILLEPACGAGHMAKVLSEYFAELAYSDAYDYGFGSFANFTKSRTRRKSYDCDTNPPFRLLKISCSMQRVARVGVAILARTVFLESVGRYDAIFRDKPPAKFAQFVERVPMVRGA